MVDENVIAAKLAVLEGHIERVTRHRPGDAKSLGDDRDAFDLVSFNLMLAVQTCVDIASHVIADQGWPPATDLAQAFHRLHQRGAISGESGDALARAVGLRNVIAHVYAETDPELVFQAATSGIDDLRRFSREIASWVRQQSDRR